MDKLNTIKLFIYDNKRKIILVSVLFLVFMVSCIVILNMNHLQKNEDIENLAFENIVAEKLEANKKTEESNDKNNEQIYYFVDIKGYVNNPGVYSLEKGKRVVDVINKAGGIKKGC